MATTNFQSGTVIASAWLNDVNGVTYNKTFPDGSVALSTAIYTVSTLPTANFGYRAFVSDATATTFGSVVVGGGSNKVPVYADGTNWKIG